MRCIPLTLLAVLFLAVWRRADLSWWLLVDKHPLFPQRVGLVLIANHVWSTERRPSRSYRMQRCGRPTLLILDSPSPMFSRSNIRSRLCGLHRIFSRPSCDLVLPVEAAADVNWESHLWYRVYEDWGLSMKIAGTGGLLVLSDCAWNDVTSVISKMSIFSCEWASRSGYLRQSRRVFLYIHKPPHRACAWLQVGESPRVRPSALCLVYYFAVG